MTELDPLTLTTIVVQLLTACGIVAFWVTARHESFDQPWRPPGFALHERAFTIPDLLTAAILVASALLLGADREAGRQLGLVAAGMLLFLGTLDAVYMQRSGLFLAEHEGRQNAVVVVTVLAVAAFLIGAHLTASRALC